MLALLFNALSRLSWHAGAIGNGFDRLTRGHVVDFIHLHAWPVFNVADVLVVVGGAFLAFGRRTTTRAARAS